MEFPGRLAGLLLAMSMIVSCSEPAVEVKPGVSLALAHARAASVSNVHYRLRFAIPADPQAQIEAQVEIGFDLGDSATPLQLDFREDGEKIHALRANGAAVDYQFVNEHIIVPASALQAGRNSLKIDFIAGSNSLNRNPGYLYTLFVPDRARTAFPLFDQPDLKARYELTLEIPETWRAMSSSPVSRVSRTGGSVHYHFAASDLISSYLFSFVAGEFEAITREIDGRSMTLFHRETDQAKLARNLDAVFELHSAAIAWMEEYTGVAFPFQKLDFALIPSFQYGGMEHVGAIQYRAAHLLLDESPSDRQRLNRAQLIAHETAHMWFGDLVTMRWFNDVWTKEVFANFMAGKIVNPGFPEINHDLNFLVDHYPPAYAVDRSEGPNPIRQQLPNLNEAGQMYGSIIYHKAPIMMRQLELLVGAGPFREGMREYLRSYSHANATWPDLIAILDARTDNDLATWSRVWVNTPGRPQFLLTTRVDAGDSAGAQLRQHDPWEQGRVWPQQFELLALGVDEQARTTLFATGESTSLPALFPAVDSASYLYSADGYGYGLFPVDMNLFQAWSGLGEVEKGAALINSYEALLEGSVPDVPGYVELLLQILQSEQNQLLLELALGQLKFTYRSLLTDAQRAQQTPLVESILWKTALAREDKSLRKVFFKAFSALASSALEVRKLHEVWLGELTIDDLTLDEADMIALAEILAIRLPDKSGAIIERQMTNTDNPDRRRRLAFIASSLAGELAVRDDFFASLHDAPNRNTESWVIDGLYNLHHPSRLAVSEKYLLPSLELLQEIQVTGDIFFPTAWLMATLGNYRSSSAVATVRSFLEARPDYNAQLRMKILQAADPMFRANRISRLQGGNTRG